MERKIAMPLLGVLLWVLLVHSSSFATASFISFQGKTNGVHNKDTNSAPKDLPVLNVNQKHLNESAVYGEIQVSRVSRLETSLGWSQVQVQPGTAPHGLLISTRPGDEAIPLARAALVAARASQHLLSGHCRRLTVNRKECARLLTTMTLSQTPLQGVCSLVKQDCTLQQSASKYRSIDGSCNSPAEGTRGRSLTAYRRALPAVYLDEIMEPRRSVTKKSLPSARFVSAKLVGRVDRLDSEKTLAFMQWSQFIAHDMTHTPTSKMLSSRNPIVCCDRQGYKLIPRYVHPMCLPISIPSDDPFYSRHRTNCMSYVRSLPAVRPQCNFGPIEQMNQATHFLDGSHVYGSIVSKANSLREFSGGRLLTSEKSGRHFLPLANNAGEFCQSSSSTECYKSGDSRVNLQPHLTAMHTFWTREHNRIAAALAKINSQWNDERLYQEARKIVIAEIQHITYTHWLPNVVGKMDADKINSQNSYMKNVDASVSNSFATAAIRFLNSLMVSELHVYSEDRVANKSIRLQDHFNRPSGLQTPGNLDGLVRGLATQSTQMMDLHFISDITEQLYKVEKYGMDALSLDIQRGRDHGLPPYVEYRQLCGLSTVSSFDGFSDHIPQQVIEALKSVYASPLDVDLIVGGLAERPIPGGLLGPTFTCLLTDQMRRTRSGDRFFYAFDPSFNEIQLQELRKVSLARIFCDNGDDIRNMQPDVFSAVKDGNKLVSCEDSAIEKMNLDKWKESTEW